MKCLIWMFLFISCTAFAQTAAKVATVNNPPVDSITGRVLGEDGQPLGGALVNVFKIGSNTATGTMTDAEGKFAVKNLVPGAYRVSALLSSYVSAGSNVSYHFVGDHVTLSLVKGGVITGRVLNAQNEPVVGAMVAAQRTRNEDGGVLPGGGATLRSAMTDDRGVYRIFGLPAGAYFVVVRTGAGLPANMTIDAPTYFPSSTRDTAQEVTVSPGAEVAGLDIQFRGERGYSVSGTVSGLPPLSSNGYVSLNLIAAGKSAGISSQSPQLIDNRFVISGVPDGEYELRASHRAYINGTSDGTSAYAAPLKVKIRGNDVTGLELKFTPAAMISGRVILEKYTGEKGSCAINREGRLDEMFVQVAPYNEDNPGQLSTGLPSVPDTAGNFALRDLSAGSFRFFTQLPSKFWYLKDIQFKSSVAKPPLAHTATSISQAMSLSAYSVELAAGEHRSGVTIILAEGAASVEGKVVLENGAGLPSGLQVYLLSVAAASDALRSARTAVNRDATFAFHHLAPGKYWLVVRPAPASVGEPDNRAQLRREAESANNEIELLPCQRLKNYSLRLR